MNRGVGADVAPPRRPLPTAQTAAAISAAATATAAIAVTRTTASPAHRRASRRMLSRAVIRAPTQRRREVVRALPSLVGIFRQGISSPHGRDWPASPGSATRWGAVRASESQPSSSRDLCLGTAHAPWSFRTGQHRERRCRCGRRPGGPRPVQAPCTAACRARSPGRSGARSWSASGRCPRTRHLSAWRGRSPGAWLHSAVSITLLGFRSR